MEKNIEYNRRIKEKALEIGFSACGITRAVVCEQDKHELENWLGEGMHAGMDWMKRHESLRKDPEKLFKGAKSVISVLLNYYTSRMQKDSSAPVISKYAYGRDYHKVLKKKLKELLIFTRELMPEAKGRAFVDSAPVLEHAFARNAGLGWIGKHSLLINPEFGSYVFIGEIFIDREIDCDSDEIPDRCGSCRLCVVECPTHAIQPGRKVDAGKCISYLTIENRGDMPEEFKDSFFNRVFGCDICQEVCPWNRSLKEHKVDDFEPSDELMEMTADEWKNLDRDRFERLFTGTAVKRTEYEGFRRNIEFLD